MINSLSLYPFLRPTWGYFDPLALAQIEPFAYEDCYLPRYYIAPDNDQEVLAAGAYLQYGLEITAGSIIWGAWHPPATGNFTSPGFVFSITDMSLGVKVFDGPTPDIFVSQNGPVAFPWLLNCPYPVVGNGLFNVEFWNNSGGSLRCNLVLGVLEVNQCKS